MKEQKSSARSAVRWPLRCLMGFCTLISSCTDRRTPVVATQPDLHAQPATNTSPHPPAREARDWNAHPAIVQLQVGSEIDVVGDVHGDWERLVELLVAGRLIETVPDTPAEVRWSGGDKVLVSVGDLINKYDHGMEVIALLRALEPQAQRAGGAVVVLMGNHEAEFLAGQRSGEFSDELTRAGIRPADVTAGVDRLGIGQYLRNLPFAAKINDWFMCHAGNTHGLTFDQLNQQLMAGVEHGGYGSPILSDYDSLLEARMHPHPWWEGAKKKDRKAGEEVLKKNLAALGAHHLVFGHQPRELDFSDGSHRQAGEMFSKFDGLVFLIDTGMSRGAGSGRGALLRIRWEGQNQIAEALYPDRSTRGLWESAAR
jgi:hypothetical protein